MQPQILIVDGATGAGKSTVLDLLRRQALVPCVVARKLTTRRRRPTDNDWEFKFVEQIDRSTNPHWFESLGNHYALESNELLEAISTKTLFVTSAVDRNFISSPRNRFDVHVMYIFRPWTRAEFNNLIEERGGVVGSEDSERRWTEIQSAADDYAAKLPIYNSVIINAGAAGLLVKQVQTAIQSWSS